MTWIPVPSRHVERQVVQLRRPQRPMEFLYQFNGLLAILEPCRRGAEIPRLRRPIGTDRTKIRQAQHGAVILADVAACFASGSVARNRRNRQPLR